MLLSPSSSLHFFTPPPSLHPLVASTSPRHRYILPSPTSPRRSGGSRNQADDHRRRNVIRPVGMARPALRRRAIRAARVKCVGKAATERRAPQAQGPARCARSLSLSKSRRASKRAVRWPADLSSEAKVSPLLPSAHRGDAEPRGSQPPLEPPERKEVKIQVVKLQAIRNPTSVLR